MPLARIVCQSPDAASPVSQRLSELGYEVEIVGSAQGHERACDVLLEIDQCSLAEALARAEAFGAAHADGQVLVASGVLHLETTVPQPGAAPETAARVPEELREFPQRTTTSWRGVFARALGLRARWAERNRSKPEPGLCIPVAEEVAALEQPPARGEEVQELSQVEAAPSAEEQEQRELEWAAREAEIARRNREAQAEVLRMAGEVENWSAPPAAAAAEEVEARINEPYQHEEAVGPSQVTPTPAPLAEATVPVAETPAPEALQPSVAAVVEARVLANAPAAQPAVAPLRRRVRMRPRGPRMTPRRPAKPPRRGREWKIAIISASVFSLMLIAGWSLATEPRPASPLSSQQIIQGSKMQQEVPFGPVRLSNQPPKPSLVQTPRPAAAPAKAPAKAQTKPRAQRTRRSSAIAEDTVVVRQFRNTRPSENAAQANNRVKRFSDVD